MRANCNRYICSLEALLLLSLLCLAGTLLTFSVLFKASSGNEGGNGNKERDYDSSNKFTYPEAATIMGMPMPKAHGQQQPHVHDGNRGGSMIAGAPEPAPWASSAISLSKPIQVRFRRDPQVQISVSFRVHSHKCGADSSRCIHVYPGGALPHAARQGVS